jgi:hypothetical protein
MRNFILKNIRKLKELSRHPLAPTYVRRPCAIDLLQPQGRARPLEHVGAISLVRYADFDELDHLGEKSRASGFMAELIEHRTRFYVGFVPTTDIGAIALQRGENVARHDRGYPQY